MTTIAFDGKMLAADSQAQGDHMIMPNVKKLHLVNNNAFIAVTGILAVGMQFIDWYQINGPYKDGHPTCDLPINWEENAFYVLLPSGAWKYENAFPIPLRAGTANGSGIFIARTAMHLGRDAHEAVKVACELDVYTGPPVVAGTFSMGLPVWISRNDCDTVSES